MFAGVESDLLPAVTSDPRQAPKKPRATSASFAGEIIVRCENARLEELPEQLWRKHTLRQLLLTGNLLSSIPAAISNLRELRILRLGYNQLTELPDEICSLKYLERLELDHNQLQLVPRDLCRLVLLEVVVLDSNPLTGRFEPKGPTLQELWQQDAAAGAGAAAAASAPCQSAHEQPQEQEGPLPSSAEECPDQQQQHRRQQQQPSLKSSGRLKAATQRLLEYLLGLQDPDDAMQIKQAQLAILQAAARESVTKLLRVADSANLAACLVAAKEAGLGQQEVAAVEAAQAAVASMEAAMAAEDREQLGQALKEFEELCRPGRPSGAVYKAAHTRWRQMQQQALTRAWRSSSSGGGAARSLPAAGPDTAAEGGAGVASPGQEGDGAGSGRTFLTVQELRRQQLKEAGALSHSEWVKGKQQEEQRSKAVLQAAAEEARKQKVLQQMLKTDKALDNCQKEREWPSAMTAAYPSGSFALPAERLKEVRELYAAGSRAKARSSSGPGAAEATVGSGTEEGAE